MCVHIIVYVVLDCWINELRGNVVSCTGEQEICKGLIFMNKCSATFYGLSAYGVAYLNNFQLTKLRDLSFHFT